jgi:VRR-NUC domain
VRRAAKVDLNHQVIVATLRAIGCEVLSLAAVGKGVPDLLVYHPLSGMHLIEVKSEKGKLLPGQRAFKNKWPVTVVRTAKEAIKAVRE